MVDAVKIHVLFQDTLFKILYCFRQKNFIMLPNQTWVHSPAHSKANLLTPGCGEGKYSVYFRAPSKENGQLMLRRPKLPNGFQERGFKGSVREGLQGAGSARAQFEVGGDLLWVMTSPITESLDFFPLSQCLEFRVVWQNCLFMIESEMSVMEENLCIILGN